MSTVQRPTFVLAGPEDDAEKVTQVIPGEQIEVVGTDGSWSQVVVPGQPSPDDARGYPGWVQTAELGDGRAAERTLEGPLGSTTAALLARARSYLGTPYVWAGTAATGIDCSGLTFRAAAAAGITIPRDARDQAADLQQIDLDDVQPGDLYFFAGDDHALSRITHVAIATASPAPDGARPMIHACGKLGRVVEEPMPPERRATLVSAARLPPPHPDDLVPPSR